MCNPCLSPFGSEVRSSLAGNLNTHKSVGTLHTALQFDTVFSMVTPLLSFTVSL